MNRTPLPFSGSAQPLGDRTRGMNKWMTLAVVTIGAFMGNLDASIVNISLSAMLTLLARASMALSNGSSLAT